MRHEWHWLFSSMNNFDNEMHFTLFIEGRPTVHLWQTLQSLLQQEYAESADLRLQVETVWIRSVQIHMTAEI